MESSQQLSCCRHQALRNRLDVRLLGGPSFSSLYMYVCGHVYGYMNMHAALDRGRGSLTSCLVS